MAGLQIEGDTSQISEPQLKYIQSVIQQRGFTNNKVTIEAIGKAGDNYVANVKRIIIDDGKGDTFNMVAKVAPGLEQLRAMGNTELLFRNEHIMYTKVLPKLTQLEIEAGIPPQERLRYAACYGSSQDIPNEVILLEDLGTSDFTTLDRFKSLSPDCVQSVLKSFAILHSLSYALKYKEPEVFDEYKSCLFDMWGSMAHMPEADQQFKMVEANTSNIVNSDVHKKAIKGALSRAIKDLTKMGKYDQNSKHAIIQQGDSWINNIMFKFDGETLLESIMIDYQLSKATTPAADILYMIFNCTDYQTRKAHFIDWIDFYHSELDKSLSNYGLKANFVFPRDQLDADLKRYGKIMFGLSVLLAAMLSLKSEDASVMKEAMDSGDPDKMMEGFASGLKNQETIVLVKKRLEDLVDSCHEFGLINH